MVLFQQELLSPGRVFTVGGAPRTLSAESLCRLRENTSWLLKRQWNIPVFLRHALPASVDGGPQIRLRDCDQAAGRDLRSLRAVGRLVELRDSPGGGLEQVVEVHDALVVQQIIHRKLRFSSPELRPCFRAGGKLLGPIVAHVALTNRPLASGQTPLIAVSRSAPEESQSVLYFLSNS